MALLAVMLHGVVEYIIQGLLYLFDLGDKLILER